MFKKQKIAGAVTLAILTSEVSAVKYRPPTGATPWYKQTNVGEITDPKYTHDYFVPNFGQDFDVAQSISNMASAEKDTGKKMVASFKQPIGHPVDYFVPEFGVDRDIIVNNGNLAQTERILKHTWTPPTAAQIKAGKHPQDYFVPNFGQDSEVKTSINDLNLSEGELKHTWTPPTKAEVKAAQYPKNYFVPNFGVDADIKDTQKHIADQSTKLKHTWTPVQDENGVWGVPEAAAGGSYSYNSLVQTDAEVKTASDPICPSSGCGYASEKGKATHPMNYFVPQFGADHAVKQTHESLDWAENKLRHRWVFEHQDKKKDASYTVPNFGVDEDIAWTQKNIASASKALKHEWKPVQDENGVWQVPAAASNKSYSYDSLVQTDADIKTESDPICSSAGCNYNKDNGKTAHPMDYFVPHFGKDRLIKETFNSLDWAEKHRGHEWNYTPDNSKAPAWDFRTPDFGLDDDVVVTQANIAASSKKLKHEWKPEQDENGNWIVPEPADNKSYSYDTLVQTDSKLKTESDPVCSSAGCNYASGKGPASHPKDYFVPNFGRDDTVKQTFNSLDWAEKNRGHNWVLDPNWDAAKKPIGDYRVPNFGLDDDVVVTQANIASASKKLKHEWKPVQDDNGNWVVPEAAAAGSYSYDTLVQLHKGSDPICSSANWPCGTAHKSSHPVDYKVPNFGVDEDIISTQKHVADQEKAKKHKWTPKQDDNGNYIVPEAHKAGSYSYNTLAQLSSDPICSSHGCPKSTLYDVEGDKTVGYSLDPVGMYGYDRDIVDSLSNQVQVERVMKQRLELPNYGDVQIKADTESDPICNSVGCTQWMWSDKLKGAPAAHVNYDFAPKLEGDVVNTWENLDVAEKLKNHKFIFDQAKYDAKDADDSVAYNDNMKLDSDVIDTQDHLQQEEKRQNHKFEVFKKE